jgi:hypothetical protein
MLGKLCGTEPAKRVIFVTTMWDKISPDRGTGRETDLKSHYFKPMLDLGAVAARFTNTHESACGIISRLFMLLEEQKVTLIQEEMVMIQRELAETKAAEEVLTDLQKLLRDHKQTIEALKREAERADNQQMIASLNKELADIQQRMEKTFREVQKLKIPFSRRIRRLFASKPKQVSEVHFNIFWSSISYALVENCRHGDLLAYTEFIHWESSLLVSILFLIVVSSCRQYFNAKFIPYLMENE